MTLRDRGRIGNRIMVERARQRAEAFAPFLQSARTYKEAEWRSGVPRRTAYRYRKMLEAR